MAKIRLQRREFIGAGAASLVFASAAQAQEASSGFEPLPSKIDITPRQLTTPVRINGNGPFHFVVDTGADRSVIADDLVQDLRLPMGPNMIVQGIIRSLEAPSVSIAELRFGASVHENLQLPIIPRKLLQADGFLGLDAIGNNRVLFDFHKKTLRVLSPLPVDFVVSSGRGETRIAAPGYGGHLRAAECRVDGISTIAFIDTGAEVSVGNEALRTALIRHDPGYASGRDIELTGITGGSRMGRVLKVDTILLGDLEFTGCEIAAADLEVFKIWDLTDHPALLIGLNFLREFQSVSVDFGRKEYRLRLTSSTWVDRRA